MLQVINKGATYTIYAQSMNGESDEKKFKNLGEFLKTDTNTTD